MNATDRAITALEQATYYLDRSFAPTGKARAFARAAEVVRSLEPGALEAHVAGGTLLDLPNIGESTGSVITDAVLGQPSGYLQRLEEATRLDPGPGAELRAILRGDCHSHTTWSDGGADLRTMATAARDLGHEYLVVTDHSPRLTIAHGLDERRLLDQLAEIEALNVELAPFRILTGMEVDIFEDGSLDLGEHLLAQLDIVVASVHSKFQLPRDAMTRRLVLAASNPHVDILGHITNRKLTGRGRPQSVFDAEIVFAACARFGTAVEINCRPERQDPPEDLLALAVDWGVDISIDTDAHAPGQLEWQAHGCAKAALAGVPPERIINTRSAEDLLAWAAA